MPYWNISGVVNATTNPMTFVQQVNEQILYGWAGIAGCGMFGVIAFIAILMVTQDGPKSFLIAGWGMFIISLFMWPMGLVPVWWTVILLLAFAFATIFYQRRE